MVFAFRLKLAGGFLCGLPGGTFSQWFHLSGGGVRSYSSRSTPYWLPMIIHHFSDSFYKIMIKDLEVAHEQPPVW